jgi:hypothetical protein
MNAMEIEPFIEKSMEALENGMCGLDLEDFLPNKIV